MRTFLTFLVIGAANGVIYGLVALGIVLVYKGTRVFNFAQGEFGTVAMYILFLLHVTWGLNYLLAILGALVVAVLMGLATERFVVRPLASAPKVIGLVGTIGVAIIAIGIEFVVGKPEPRVIPPPFEGTGIQLADFFVSPQQILSLISLIGIAVLAALFFQRTYLGMGILANSQDSIATRLVGAHANRISLLTWGIAGLLGGVAGVLLGPQITLVPGFMTTNLLIAGFTAGVVGGMTSLIGAFAGGLVIGVIESTSRFFAIDSVFLQNIPEYSTVVLFIVLVLMLIVRPKGLFGSEA